LPPVNLNGQMFFDGAQPVEKHWGVM
jgi:hypothetical protein